MHGRIDLSSVLGAGSRFAVLVPEAAGTDVATQDELPAPPAMDVATDLTGLRVLVAEDNRVNQVVVRRISYNFV